MVYCLFTFDKQKSYSVVTVSQLLAKCPLLQIANCKTRVRLSKGNYLYIE
uniref:Uncharacterized protein n=1 Tax=Anopheles atroparvus TaxID=41427 RepID=A0AAG5DD44_ANOAO